MVVESFANRMGMHLKEDSTFKGKVAKGTYGGVKVHLLLPLTYMNLSGEAVRRYIDYFALGVEQIVVISDDVALPFGTIRLRPMGSAGGHNGLKSVEAHVGTSHYKKMRMGIGHPGEKRLESYVLEAFSPGEQIELPKIIDRGVDILQRLLKESFSHVMNHINTVLLEAPNKPNEVDLTNP
jgi:peptidyl-tRNA hydrolase, PTH1 family